MFLTRSAGRKFLVTLIAAVFFAGLYEVTVLDSRYAVHKPAEDDSELTATPAPGVRLRFTATA
jgi:hypothetical protein